MKPWTLACNLTPSAVTVNPGLLTPIQGATTGFIHEAMIRKSKKEKVPKPKKLPLGRRIGDSIRSVGEIGAESVRNPRGIPTTAHGAFRTWFRRIWDTRGGSVYTLGYALTFAALELKSFVTELAGMSSAGDFFVEQLMQFLIRFGTESIANLVQALIWPVFVITWYPPLGIALFVLALLLFPKFIKPYIEKWLFGDERPPPNKPEG